MSSTFFPHVAEGIYNAVWDEALSLCYDILQCTHCKKQVGVSVHLGSSSDLQSLVGKVRSHYNVCTVYYTCHCYTVRVYIVHAEQRSSYCGNCLCVRILHGYS